MMKMDLRKEQIALLRFEKQLMSTAFALAAAGQAAQSADGKLSSSIAGDSYLAAQTILVQLADVTDRAHLALNLQSVELGLKTMHAWGVPKKTSGEAIKLALGLG